jgi:hypothetical protein
MVQHLPLGQLQCSDNESQCAGGCCQTQMIDVTAKPTSGECSSACCANSTVMCASPEHLCSSSTCKETEAQAGQTCTSNGCTGSACHTEYNACADNGAPKAKAAPKKKKATSSAKSIWSRTSTDVKPPKGGNAQKAQKPTSQQANSSENGTSGHIDMEEIFRTVLEDASKALTKTADDTTKLSPQKKAGGGKKNSLKGNVCVTPSIVASLPIIEYNEAETTSLMCPEMDPSEQIMPQLNNFHLTGGANSECHNETDMLYMATNAYCGRLPSASHLLEPFASSVVQPSLVQNYYQYKSPGMEDAYGSNSSDETHSKNLDDIMDVLRKDQENPFSNVNDCSNSSNDCSLGYTCDDLREWIEQPSMEDISLQLGEDLLHYNPADVAHGLVVNSSYVHSEQPHFVDMAPNSMEAPSHDGVSSVCSSTVPSVERNDSEPRGMESDHIAEQSYFLDEQGMEWMDMINPPLDNTLLYTSQTARPMDALV